MQHKDRNYYRAQANAELREETKRGVNVDWHELAIVLEERLYAKETTSGRTGCDCGCDCC
jgi:hypothetical protein